MPREEVERMRKEFEADTRRKKKERRRELTEQGLDWREVEKEELKDEKGKKISRYHIPRAFPNKEYLDKVYQ